MITPGHSDHVTQDSLQPQPCPCMQAGTMGGEASMAVSVVWGLRTYFFISVLLLLLLPTLACGLFDKNMIPKH